MGVRDGHRLAPETERDFRNDEVVPLKGAEVPPNKEEPQGVLLVIGMRADKAGYYVRDGFYLNYRIDGEEYRAVLPGSPRHLCRRQRAQATQRGLQDTRDWSTRNDKR